MFDPDELRSMEEMPRLAREVLGMGVLVMVEPREPDWMTGELVEPREDDPIEEPREEELLEREGLMEEPRVEEPREGLLPREELTEPRELLPRELLPRELLWEEPEPLEPRWAWAGASTARRTAARMRESWSIWRIAVPFGAVRVVG